MASIERTPPPRRIRVRGTRVVGLLVLAAVAALAWQAAFASRDELSSVVDGLRGGHSTAHGAAGGAVPDGTTVFDDDVPGVAKLDGDLLAAVRAAADDAAAGGVRFTVDSGWRSRAYQARLLREAVTTYGSLQEARRWVATADTSAHVKGEAIDLGPPDSAAWLGDHGAAYGLCRVYANEPWHFELRPDAATSGCPAPFADPTQDPRLQS